MTIFKGVVPPVITPLTENHEVDYPSLTRVVEHLIDGGVHGLFVLGSTGEVIFHDEAARGRILDHVLKIAGGRVPVLAGVIDPTTDRTIARARAAQAAGVDAVVVTAPFYTRTSQPEVVDHFRYVREALDVPVVAYDIPVCVNIKLARDSVVTLAREGTIIGLKDSSGDDGAFRFCLLDLADRPDVFLMTGSEIMVDTALMLGAHGVVPGLANVDPHGYVRLWNHAQAGDWTAARAEQERLCRLFEMVWAALPRVSPGAAGVGSFKTAMQAMGLISTNVMARPQRRLDAADTARIVERVRAAGLMG
ncbi:MAG: dihydrodipicolinate synthase family protein [Rubellimicrobium sp.]|nr:dihydrodipicolinate synthase family protein [Rubellimicrobium sp.]